MTNVQIEVSKQEADMLFQLLDAAVRQLGGPAAGAVHLWQHKLTMAFRDGEPQPDEKT